MTTYRLEIPDEKWNQFKQTISKSRTINEVIEECIDERIQDSEKTTHIQERP